jgi:hypothetical protein
MSASASLSRAGGSVAGTQDAPENHRYESSPRTVLDGKAIFNSFDKVPALVLPETPKLLTKESDAQARAALRLEQIREK